MPLSTSNFRLIAFFVDLCAYIKLFYIHGWNDHLYSLVGLMELLSTFLFHISYVLDVNMDRVEDVLLHQRLLTLAKDPEKRPVYHIRFLEVLPLYLASLIFKLPYTLMLLGSLM